MYENGTGEAYSRWYYQDSAKVLIRSNGASYFNGGNIGIGLESPSQLLHLYQAATDSQAYQIIENNRSRNAATQYKTTLDLGM